MNSDKGRTLPNGETSGARGNTHKGSHATVERIILAAQQMLIEVGSADLTMRKVAEVAGLSLGNVTYHFPSKRDLLIALIQRLTTQYAEQFKQILGEIAKDPNTTLDQLVRWLLGDAAEYETAAIFRELWAMSLHDDVIRDCIDSFYDRHMAEVAAMLEDLYPEVDSQAAAEFVQILAMLSEGTAVLYGTCRDRRVRHERAVEKACEIMGDLLPLGGAPQD
ncbi:TetR/AcrR family transcriptional regulator [Ovoidimarina sediminis]|uniref:TetR/AcrR family transcriptional regulator n=1 Tax=Ovoidimarina sediminis TaxID=3079856 RepID=UPI00291360FF|nr:TetR/AcrR family transcriptional regulator [Rhodophyticola sp. MJ-SS7]MDU8944341.1 TetR/AcrR family transcriptional regulator [Rhodophyticola sp. MJ-SS7]